MNSPRPAIKPTVSAFALQRLWWPSRTVVSTSPCMLLSSVASTACVGTACPVIKRSSIWAAASPISARGVRTVEPTEQAVDVKIDCCAGGGKLLLLAGLAVLALAAGVHEAADADSITGGNCARLMANRT